MASVAFLFHQWILNLPEKHWSGKHFLHGYNLGLQFNALAGTDETNVFCVLSKNSVLLRLQESMAYPVV